MLLLIYIYIISVCFYAQAMCLSKGLPFKSRQFRRQIALSVELRSRASSRPEPSARCCSSVPVALQLRRRASPFRRRHIPLNCWIHCWDSCLRHEDPANICSVLLSWSWLDAPLEAAIFRSNKLSAGILILSLIR